MKQHVLRTIVGLALIAALVWFVDLHALVAVLSNLTVGIALALLALSAALIAVSAVKWKSFLDSSEHKLSLWRLFNLYLVGYFVNAFAPSFVGGDVVRSWYIGKRVGQHQAAAATILERYTGLVSMVGLALIFVWFVHEIQLRVVLLVLGVAFGVALVTVLALSTRFAKWFEHLLPRAPIVRKVFANIAGIQDALCTIGADRRRLGYAFALSLLYHSLTVLNTLVAAHAVGWDTALARDLFVVLPLILLLGALPVAPSGLGIQEGAFYFFLQSIGATPAQALGVALVLRAKSYVLALVGGVIWLGMKRKE